MKLLEFKNLTDIDKALKSEKHCRDYYEFLRWGSGAICCAHCGGEKVYVLAPTVKNNLYKCAACLKRFNCLTGTIFENTKIPLVVWFKAIHLSTTLSKGVSSTNLSKLLGVTQKTAWFMLHRIRETMDVPLPELSGIVEVDETYVGGLDANRHESKKKGSRGKKDKQPVLGIAQREGELILKPVSDTTRKTLFPAIASVVKPHSTIFTDQAEVYVPLRDNYSHSIVNHGAHEYVNGNVHTNTIEGAFGLFKRKIIGVHHFVSPKHMHRYTNEFAFSYNQRKASGFDKFNQTLRNSECRLMYKQLIAPVK